MHYFTGILFYILTQILPELPTPTIEIIRDIRPQIYFRWNSHIDEIPNTSTFTGNITYISQNIINLPVYANIPHISDHQRYNKINN